MKFKFNDGGKPKDCKAKRDCVVRAIAIATQQDYVSVQNTINHLADEVYFDGSDASSGVHKQLYKEYLQSIGWIWHPTMGIGTGCKVHLADGELPMGRLIVSCSRHLVAVIDGIINDISDCSRNGTRCVYGYWTAPTQ